MIACSSRSRLPSAEPTPGVTHKICECMYGRPCFLKGQGFVLVLAMKEKMEYIVNELYERGCGQECLIALASQ